jgi:glycosyltransferase involved in cell wall biosynthesis
VYVTAGIAEDRITLKPPVVPDPGPRAAPPSGSREVVFAARLSPEKGADVLLEAWRQARLERDGLTLTVIGDGPLRDELERSAPDVRFAGWVAPDELERRLLGARALVFPSQWVEPYGITVVTAMAAGLPVLASDVAGPGELARQLGPGWAVSPHDRAESWGAALARLCDDDAVDAAGRHGRELFQTTYTHAAGLARLESLYGSLLGDRAASTTDGARR